MDSRTGQRTPTTEKLAEAMEAAELPEEMIDAARKGFYDDYHENGHPTPQIALVAHLSMVESPEAKLLASRVIAGEFDAQPWESDEWAARQTGETREIIKKLGLE